jgi:hypothetical protein
MRDKTGSGSTFDLASPRLRLPPSLLFARNAGQRPPASPAEPSPIPVRTPRFGPCGASLPYELHAVARASTSTMYVQLYVGLFESRLAGSPVRLAASLLQYLITCQRQRRLGQCRPLLSSTPCLPQPRRPFGFYLVGQQCLS